jgi:hypothetical protein
MKKILFFAISILMFGIASSQVFIQSQDLTRLTTVTSENVISVPYTQKVLSYTKNQHITLSHTNEGKSMFTLMKNGQNISAENVTLGSEFNVKDFDIYGSTLYFCGSYNNDGINEAFLGYVDIDDFFAPINYAPLEIPKIKYTLINNIYQDSIFSINRIEVFQDSTNIVVAGIGEMYYGEPPYAKKIYDTTGLHNVIFDPIEYYLDFFMLYTIKEDSVLTNQQEVDTGAFPIYNVTNDFEIFYVPTDTANSCYYNKFADITETNNKIYLTSINYSDTSINFSTEHATYIDVISFDKLTRQQQAGRITLPYPVHQDYGVKTTVVDSDNIAIACNLSYYQHNNYACAFKISPNPDSIFNISNVSLFDYLGGRFGVFDVEFLETRRELVILKKSIIDGSKEDLVFHLNMDTNVSYPYYSYKYKITHKDYYLCYSDLNKSDTSNYTIIGSVNNNFMFVYDTKNVAYLEDSPCFTKETFQVITLSPFLVSPIPPLSQCKFSKQITSSGNIFTGTLYLSTDVHKTIINLQSIPFKKNSVLNNCCLK